MTRMNKSVLISVLMMGLALPGILFAETVDRVVAVVNQEPITLYQLDQVMALEIDEIKSMMGAYAKQKKFKDTRSLALKKLIDEKLLDQEMKKRNIEVTDQDVNKAINNVLERNKLTQAQLIQELKGKGTSFPEYREQVREQLRRLKFMGQFIAPRVKVTDADLDEFFAKNQDKFARFQSVDMAQIIIPVDSTAGDAEYQKAQATALDVTKKARAGANFENLGKKYSMNPQTAVRSVYPAIQLAPQISAALADLQPGGVSDPVRTHMGIHVIKLFDRKTLAGEDFKVIREQIREKVFELKIEDETLKYLEEVKENSYIEIKA